APALRSDGLPGAARRLAAGGRRRRRAARPGPGRRSRRRLRRRGHAGGRADHGDDRARRRETGRAGTHHAAARPAPALPPVRARTPAAPGPRRPAAARRRLRGGPALRPYVEGTEKLRRFGSAGAEALLRDASERDPASASAQVALAAARWQLGHDAEAREAAD